MTKTEHIFVTESIKGNYTTLIKSNLPVIWAYAHQHATRNKKSPDSSLQLHFTVTWLHLIRQLYGIQINLDVQITEI